MTSNASKTATPDNKAASTDKVASENQRIRLRFAKQGDLRLVSHRDMVRAFERMFRRVGVSLAMSEGFHPRPKMTFPDALSLGVAASDEVMDITLAERVEPEDFKERLNRTCPEGLVIHTVQILGEGDRKARIDRVVYELDLGADTDQTALQHAIDELASRETLVVDRKGKQIEIDLKQTLDRLWLDDGRLMMSIRVVQQSQLQPRDILSHIGLPDFIRDGGVLTRTRIELTP